MKYSAGWIQAMRGTPARTVTYGHGLFSSRFEVLRDAVSPTAEDYPMMIFATDFIGLAEDDLPDVIGAIVQLDRFGALIDRVAQGVLHQVLLPRAIASCASDPAFQVAGRPAYDPAEVYYYGNSQGGNLGIAVAALSLDVDRFALGVGGISYPIMLPRSVNWPMLESILASYYTDRFERDLLM